MTALVVTAWVGDGTEENPNRPSVADAYPLRKWADVTGQPSVNLRPDPNAFTVRVECEPDVLERMDADGVPILWAEDALKRRDSVLTADEAADLASRLVALGYDLNEITEIVQGGVRRDDVAAALIAAQREAPKAA